VNKTGAFIMNQELKPSEITPEDVYKNRRLFMRAGLVAASGVATAGVYRYFNPAFAPEVASSLATEAVSPSPSLSDSAAAMVDKPNTFAQITRYNNFYEFSTNKTAVAAEASGFVTQPWSVEVGGMVAKPRTFGLEELLALGQEERVYRFRCVEGWSMVIPWVGFPLAKLLELVQPQSGATHVAFETYYDKQQMPNGRFAGIELPYVEGLRLDEAVHPLTILATGLYGKPMPNQNGAPIRLVVPWKYGFKSIKSIVRITLTNQVPPTTWNKAAPSEYGFYSNVNPTVDHPRWSQADEQRIGEFSRRPTLMFNGYEDEVAALYRGMDLKAFF
jgi:sulfoxide reductase catalytic subunit YedY